MGNFDVSIPSDSLTNWNSTLTQLEQMVDSIKPLASIPSSILGDVSSVLDSFQSFRTGYLQSVSDVQAMLEPLRVNYFSQLTSSLLEIQEAQRHLWKGMSPALQLVNQSQELMNAFKEVHLTNIVDISSSLSSIFADYNIRDIDLSGFEDLEVDSLSPSIQDVDHQESGAVAPGQKKLIDMTEEDLTKLVTKAITAAGAFSLPVFIYQLYAEYVNDAARVLIEIMFAFSLTFVMGQYNAEVKAEIADTIQDSMAVKDTRKVITKYIKVNPVDQVAFLRKESYLRQGNSKASPVVAGGKISAVSVLTVIERKNNWIKVEVDTGKSCGETGWIEESKVVKFKKVK